MDTCYSGPYIYTYTPKVLLNLRTRVEYTRRNVETDLSFQGTGRGRRWKMEGRGTRTHEGLRRLLNPDFLELQQGRRHRQKPQISPTSIGGGGRAGGS